jgi:hypothetical protein
VSENVYRILGTSNINGIAPPSPIVRIFKLDSSNYDGMIDP